MGAMGLAFGLPPATAARAEDAGMAAREARWTPVDDRTARLDITSALTGRDYAVLVRIPEGPAPAEGWPTLWMLDGFATFPLVADRRLADGTAPGGLIIAVGFPSGEDFDNARRSEAYTPVPDADPGAPRSGPVFGGAGGFRRFLLEELRPEIARRFPLASDRGTLFGFSYGGLFTLDTVLTAPGSFTRYWAASPSLWFSEAQIPRRLRAGAGPAAAPGDGLPRVTITAGLEEQFPTEPLPAERLAHLRRRAMIDNTTEVARLLGEAGFPVELRQMPGLDHMGMLRDGAERILDAAFGADPFAGTTAGAAR